MSVSAWSLTSKARHNKQAHKNISLQTVAHWGGKVQGPCRLITKGPPLIPGRGGRGQGKVD